MFTDIVIEDKLRLELEWWLALAPTLDWTVAKTMSDYPHAYVVRDKTLGEEDFMRAVKVIRTFGEPAKFFSRTNIYLTDPVTNLKWWTMGDTLDGTIIINQAPADVDYGDQDAPSTSSEVFTIYDELATYYDARYDTPFCHEENEAIRKLISHQLGAIAPTTLDAGCGTGLLLDLKITHPLLFTGIDPSQGMLNELVRKHPRVKKLTAARMEDVPPAPPRSFELVVSLFGSPSYMPAGTIRSLAASASKLAVFMHYREGYAPDYERVSDIATHVESREAAAALPGAMVSGFHDFQLTLVRP